MARRIPHDEPGDFAEYLRARVADGSASLARVHTSAGVVGFVVYSVSVFAGGVREFVVLAAFGRDARDLTAEAVPELETLAREEGCASIRFHTLRPGLVVKAARLGFRVSEVILRKSL